MYRAALLAIIISFPLGAFAAKDVTSAAERKKNLLEYVAEREDLTRKQKANWDKAIRLTFGGKSLNDGEDEGVTVAKSVISAAIFYDIPPKQGAKAAYEAYGDSLRWVPPPIAINYQILSFQGRRPKASAKQLAFQFPRYFNEEMAPDLASWWSDMLKQGKIPDWEQPEIKELLGQTRKLMRPMMLDRLWQAAQLQARLKGNPNSSDLQRDLKDLGDELHRDFAKVHPHDDNAQDFYSRYQTLANVLNVDAQPAPAVKRPKQVKAPPPPPPVRKPTPKTSTPPKKPPMFAPAAPKPKTPQPKPSHQVVAPLSGDPLVPPYQGWKKRLSKEVNSWIGTPYVFGGTSRQGVDCSAFTRAVFNGALSIRLPRNSRAQFRTGKSIKQKQLKPGDLVFFDTLDRGRVTHVGVYLGNGVMAHASSSKGVTRAKLGKRYYQRAYWGGRRHLNQ
jgi:cell wall-associated NlpC family hydrolase